MSFTKDFTLSIEFKKICTVFNVYTSLMCFRSPASILKAALGKVKAKTVQKK